MHIRLALFFVFILPFKCVVAATYYVDSSFGNDNWGGQLAAPIGWPATDGPWQSLAKVSAQILAPGDSVLLKCGGTWNETLKLKNSGTATNPITVGFYPNNCPNKPIISGATPIPAHNWIRDTGNIYKLSSAIDLITFGTFESGWGNWVPWSPNHNAIMTLSSSCATTGTCLSFTAGSEDSIASSNNFTLQGQQAYTVTFTLKSPVGVPVWAILRRGASPWDTVGLAKSVIGTGTWQTVTFPFTSTASLANARLDFVVPAGRNVGLDSVKVTSTITNVIGIFDSGKSINMAHHPNRGYESLKPDSLYYAIADNADVMSLTNGTTGSNYLTTGLDLAASPHPAITAGTGIRVRTNAWTINDRKIVSISGSRLYFDTPTTHPLKKGWGYFLYGQRWMLDEPGEWHYEATTKTISVWMSDNSTPGKRISIGQRALGLDLRNLSHLRIKGLAIQNMGAGVDMLRANNIVLSNMAIVDTLGEGIDALLSKDSGVENSQIIRTDGNAITASLSVRFHAYYNLISDSGVQTKNGVITSLPSPSTAAIAAGDSAIIKGNRIYGTGYAGIFALANNLISENHIENVCLVLDDCGAIYTSGSSNPNIRIENNTVFNVKGGVHGKPLADAASQAQGIYLDELSRGVIVKGNTVANADNGIQIHNAAKNRIENNTLYGNRRHQIWLQEQTSRLHAEGDIYDNIVLGNRLFSISVATNATTAIKQETKLPKNNTNRFSSYDNNRYFTLLSPTISSEIWPSGNASYNLPEWKTAVTASYLPRNLDLTASEVNSAKLGYAAYRTIWSTIVPNGNLASGLTGWEFWNSTAPYGVIALEPCTPAQQCLRYTAGASVSQLSSPKLTVQQDKWYKVSFDLRSGSNAQPATVVVRRGGGGTNGYENLMSAPVSIVGSTIWQRYGFIFKATKTVNVNDPITLDEGARVDFDGVMPGQSISVTNLEVVPLSAVDASLRSHILINPSGTIMDFACPNGNDINLCSQYVRFTDGLSVIWPHAVAPHASEVIYSRDSSLIDGDGDGIPDSQDLCKGTLASRAVNGTGCGLGQ